MLQIDRISKTFSRNDGDVRVLEHFSLKVKPGEVVTVQGPSGCGKTTLLLIAAGLLHPDEGTVRIDDAALYDLSAEARAGFRSRHIGVVFQQFHLMPYLSVLDNILAPELVSKRSLAADARLLIEQFGLEHRASHKPSELSIGERQRTALARALVSKPSLILADEPSANLDEDNATIILTALRKFAEDGRAVLMVSHDKRAADIADQTIDM